MYFSDDDEEEMSMEERQKTLYGSPLFKKAREITDICVALCHSMSKEDAERVGHSLMESAMIIPAKIAGAFHNDSWVICMENASLVRHHAQFLMTATSSLDELTHIHAEHAQVLRKAMIEFRELFKEWCDKIHRLEKNDWDEDEWVLYRR